MANVFINVEAAPVIVKLMYCGEASLTGKIYRNSVECPEPCGKGIQDNTYPELFADTDNVMTATVLYLDSTGTIAPEGYYCFETTSGFCSYYWDGRELNQVTC